MTLALSERRSSLRLTVRNRTDKFRDTRPTSAQSESAKSRPRTPLSADAGCRPQPASSSYPPNSRATICTSVRNRTNIRQTQTLTVASPLSTWMGSARFLLCEDGPMIETMQKRGDDSEIVSLPRGWFLLGKESCSGRAYFALCRPDGSAVGSMLQQDARDFLAAMGAPLPRGRWPWVAK